MNSNMLNEILHTQSKSYYTDRMNRVIRRRAKRMGATVEEIDGNLYVTKGKGNTYPCVVAHTDTVHPILPQREYRVKFHKGNYFAYNPVLGDVTGIGGDDKNGIFIALSALEDFPVMKAAFFRDEEVGCRGSAVAEMGFFEDCTMVLQCDRHGDDDFVNSIMGIDLYGDEFAAAIRPILREYGYRERSGMITDVGELKERGLGVAAANMSCGYYNAHSKYEHINLTDLLNTRSLVYEAIRQLGSTVWKHDAEPSWKKYHMGWESEYDDWWNSEYTYSTKSMKKIEEAAKKSTSTKQWASTNNGRAMVATGTGELMVLPESVTSAADHFGTDAAGNVRGGLLYLSCPNCRKAMRVDYDHTVELYFCQGCFEYVASAYDDDDDQMKGA